jgi:osmotically-inducible protein OsmY
VNTTVDNGIVTVEGNPETASVGRDMIEEIRHVEGVVAVRDQLSRVPEQPSVPRTDMDLDF